MKSLQSVVMLTAVTASLGVADNFKTVLGKEYKDPAVTRIEPNGLVLKTKAGISKVYFTELPKAVQERFHYVDSAKIESNEAAAVSAKEQAAITTLSKLKRILK